MQALLELLDRLLVLLSPVCTDEGNTTIHTAKSSQQLCPCTCVVGILLSALQQQPDAGTVSVLSLGLRRPEDPRGPKYFTYKTRTSMHTVLSCGT